MSVDPKTPLDEAREALAILSSPRCYLSIHTPQGWRDCKLHHGHTGECNAKKPAMPMEKYLRAALAEVDRFTAENARLREALAGVMQAEDQLAMPDPYTDAAFATARRVLAEVTRGQ